MFDSKFTPTEQRNLKVAGAHRLRVAMVIQRFRPDFTGQGKQLELLCRMLVRRGIAPTVITPGHDRKTREEQIDGYRVVRLRSDMPLQAVLGRESRQRGLTFAARTLTFLLAQPTFDLVHVHALTDALYTSWLWCRWQNKPLLFEMTLMGDDDPVSVSASRNRPAALRQAIFRRCDGYVAISPALEKKYLEAGFPKEKVQCLPQGVDIHQFRPVSTEDRVALRQHLGVPSTGPLLVFVGSLIHRKGLDVLLTAWKDIHAERPSAHLILVGKNCFQNHVEAACFLEQQLFQLPVAAANHVHQLGVRDDVQRVLQAADLFVFPSRREGFGTVMIEAMACALPCVVAELPGITDFVFGSSTDAGQIIPQEDPLALVAAVNAILSDPVRAVEIGRTARVRVVDRFDIDRVVDRYISYYAELTSKPGVRHSV